MAIILVTVAEVGRRAHRGRHHPLAEDLGLRQSGAEHDIIHSLLFCGSHCTVPTTPGQFEKQRNLRLLGTQTLCYPGRRAL